MDNRFLLPVLALLCLPLMKLAAAPVKLLAKLSLHGFLGLGSLWLLNSVAWLTGVTFPVNTVTALLAGYLGLPGILLTAVIGRL